MSALTVEDQLEINTLCRRYARAADEGDAKGFADCFTEDGVLESYLGEPISGRQELEAYAARIRDGARERGVQLRMWVDNVLCDALDEGAECSAYVLAFETARGGAPAPIYSGLYHDRLVRVGGSWRLAHRRATSDAA